VLFPHTYQVRDYAPKLATRLGQALIRRRDRTLVTARSSPANSCKAASTALIATSGNGPCFVSVQAGAFRADEAQPGTAAVSVFSPTIEPAQIRTRPSERFRGAAQTVDLGSAQLIVGVGSRHQGRRQHPAGSGTGHGPRRGAGCIRPICDNGWLAMERQIGSSGQTIAPKLYLALGISGAIQHLVGIKGSQCVVAVNKDPGAPIFEAADYGHCRRSHGSRPGAHRGGEGGSSVELSVLSYRPLYSGLCFDRSSS